jgi:hypothetical protein
MSDQELMNYFTFDESDLQANRNGQISEQQKVRVLKRDKSHLSLTSLFSSKFGYKLAKVQGPIKIEDFQTAYHGGMLWHDLQVGGKSFIIKKDLPNVMAPGDVFAIYYCYAEDAPDDNGLYEILSAERITVLHESVFEP